LKLIGGNSNVLNIHHTRLSHDCSASASGYDDEYRGSGAEE
jgi:hypothetical protein